MKCEYCVRRPRHVGGNESCAILHRREVALVGARSEREPVEDAWKRHVPAHPTGCFGFQPGDLRPVAPPAEQEQLF